MPTTENNGNTEQSGRRLETQCVEAVDLRDYFAAAALTALVAHDDGEFTAAELAHDAYFYADSMLAEREKEHP